MGRGLRHAFLTALLLGGAAASPAAAGPLPKLQGLHVSSVDRVGYDLKCSRCRDVRYFGRTRDWAPLRKRALLIVPARRSCEQRVRRRWDGEGWCWERVQVCRTVYR